MPPNASVITVNSAASGTRRDYCAPPRKRARRRRYNPRGRTEGRSSTGRAPVSKTGGWGFESLRPCRSSCIRLIPCLSRRRRGAAWSGCGQTERQRPGFPGPLDGEILSPRLLEAPRPRAARTAVVIRHSACAGTSIECHGEAWSRVQRYALWAFAEPPLTLGFSAAPPPRPGSARWVALPSSFSLLRLWSPSGRRLLMWRLKVAAAPGAHVSATGLSPGRRSARKRAGRAAVC